MPDETKVVRYTDVLADVAGLFEMSASGPEDDRTAAALRALAALLEEVEAWERGNWERSLDEIVCDLAAGYREGR